MDGGPSVPLEIGKLIELRIRAHATLGAIWARMAARSMEMRSIRMWLKILAVLPAILLDLSGCTALTVYNDLVPQDRASEIVKRDVAYGSEHRQKLDIYVPARNVAGKDVVVFFYGGSWKLGRKEEVSFV